MCRTRLTNGGYIPGCLTRVLSQSEATLSHESLGGRREGQQVSKAIAGAGIPGIKYKDAGSRAGDGGTHNYVVFDDSLINNLGAAP